MPDLPHEGAPKPHMGPGGWPVPTCRLLAKQPIVIAAIKEAVGLDTLPAAWEMSMVHFDKRVTAEKKNGLLPLAWLFLALAILFASIGVGVNL